MKTKSFFSLIAAAVLMVSCNSEEQFGVGQTGKSELRATVEGNQPSTRVGFTNTGTFYWSTGDQMLVVNGDTKTMFDLSSGAGEANATFTGSGTVAGYAIYPFNEGHNVTGENLVYNFPATYNNYTPNTVPFVEDKTTGQSFNPAMFGEIKNGSVSLSHLGGIFVVQVNPMKVAAGKFTFTVSKKISGSYTTALSTATTDGIAAAAAESDDEKTVTFNFTGATVDGNAVFYIPVPVGTYDDVCLKIADDTKTYLYIQSSKTYNIKRRSIYGIKIQGSELVAGEQAVVEDLEDAAASFAEKNSVSVSGEVASGSKVTIPTTSTTENIVPKSLTLENVASGADITVSEGDGAVAGEEFTLSIPETNTGDTPLNATLDMGNTSVTLAGNTGTTTFGTVTATTYDETLILTSGVTINNLVVKQGNVRMAANSKIVAITNDMASGIVYIEADDAAELPDNLDPTKFQIVKSLSDVKAEKELRAALADNSTASYTLTGNIQISSPLVVAKEFTLNLGSYSITPSGTSLTAAEGTASKDALVVVRRGGKLTLSGTGSIDSGENSAIFTAIKMTDGNDTEEGNAELVVNDNPTLKGYYCAVAGNGKRHGTTIDVNGGTLTAYNGTGIYHPQDGTLTVDGGEISGAECAVEMRAGTFTMTAGKLTSTATATSSKANGSGSTIIGAALAVSQHTTEKAINVTISGGELVGPSALYEEDLQAKPTIVTMSVTGGTFTGKVYSQNCTGFIAGGNFTDPSAMNYIASGKSATITLLDNVDDNANTYVLPTGATAVLDLNGKTISHASATPVSMITNNGNLTIKDSGTSGKIAFTFNGTVNNASAANAIKNNGNLVIESGTISNTGTGSQIGYAIDNYNGATLQVNGGTITATGSTSYDGIRLFCGSNETTVTINDGTISTIWAQNPSNGKATEVNGTVIINGGTIGTTYYENYTVVKVKDGVTTTVTAYGAGSDNTTTTTEGGYTVYSFVQSTN